MRIAIITMLVLLGCTPQSHSTRFGPQVQFEKDRVTLVISENVRYVGRIEERDEPVAGMEAWSGSLQGAPGTFTIVQSGTRRLVTIHLPEKVIEVRDDRRRGAPIIRELARSDDLPCGVEDTAVPSLISAAIPDPEAPCSTECDDAADDVAADAATSEQACARNPKKPYPPPVDIKVLVAYSQQVKAAVGTEEMKVRIGRAIKETNIAFKNSGVPARLVLATWPFGSKCWYALSYDETTTNYTVHTYLNQLLDSTDPALGIPLRRKRNRCRADVVVLIVKKVDDYSGVACRMLRLSPAHAPHAYAVVRLDSMTLDYVFTHELGHIMGGGHYEEADCRIGMCSYSSASSFAHGGTTYSSMMASDVTLPATLYFSGPDIYYSGTTVTGSDQADNARTLRISARTVSQFR